MAILTKIMFISFVKNVYADINNKILFFNQQQKYFYICWFFFCLSTAVISKQDIVFLWENKIDDMCAYSGLQLV
jgi:hypothetical protein